MTPTKEGITFNIGDARPEMTLTISRSTQTEFVKEAWARKVKCEERAVRRDNDTID